VAKKKKMSLAERRRQWRELQQTFQGVLDPLTSLGDRTPAPPPRRSEGPETRLWTPAKGDVIGPPPGASAGTIKDIKPKQPKISQGPPAPTLVAPEIPLTKQAQAIERRQQRETRAYMGSPLAQSAATVLNMPLGMALSAHAVGSDIKNAAEGDFSFKGSRQMGKEIVKGTVESLEHPGRDPAATILSAFGIASLGAGSVARLGVVSKLASEGRFAEAAKAMGRTPPGSGPKRIFTDPEGNTVRGVYSRAVLSRQWQRAHDTYLMKAAQANPEGKAASVLRGRMAREERKNLTALKDFDPDLAKGLPVDTLLTGGSKNNHWLTTKNAAHAWDTMNDAVKMTLIYAKIGYIPPNFLGNLALNFMTQGPAALPRLARAAMISRKMGGKDAALMDRITGAGIAKAIVGGGKNPLSKAAEKTADIVSIPTDRYTRRSAFIHEMEKAGYHGVRGFRLLTRNPKLRGDLTEVARRARENAIEYENLTELEKSIVKRAVFIYPWIKGSTTFAGRFARDHPIQSATYYQMGKQGKKYADEHLGPRPSYMEGNIPGEVLGLGKNRLVDPRGITMFGTGADLYSTLRGVAKGEFPDSASPAEWLNPILQLAGGYAFGVDPRSGAPTHRGNPLKFLWEHFGKTTPQVTQAEAVKDAITGKKPSPNKIMQRTPLEDIGRIFGGSVTPSTFSKKNLNRVGIGEAVSMLPRKDRMVYRIRKDRDEMEIALAQAKVPNTTVNGKLNPALKRAWDLYEKRKLATADIRRPPPGATEQQSLDYQRASAEAELREAVRLKLLPEGTDERMMLAVNQVNDAGEIRKLRAMLAKDLYMGGLITGVRSLTKKKK
jgi:hypothetical protein